jgi:hypothetical protein
MDAGPATARLVVSRTDQPPFIPPLTPDLVSQSATPRPIGTPDADLQGTVLYVDAEIDAGSTDFEPTRTSPGVTEQRADDNIQPWTWSLAPRSAGTRQATLNVTLVYRSPDNNSVTLQRPAWSQDMSIEVQQKGGLVIPLLGLEIPVGSVGPTLIQAGISSQVPLAIAWLRARLKRQPATPAPRRKRKA